MIYTTQEQVDAYNEEFDSNLTLDKAIEELDESAQEYAVGMAESIIDRLVSNYRWNFDNFYPEYNSGLMDESSFTELVESYLKKELKGMADKALNLN